MLQDMEFVLRKSNHVICPKMFLCSEIALNYIFQIYRRTDIDCYIENSSSEFVRKKIAGFSPKGT